MRRLLGLKIVLLPIVFFIFIISLIFSLRGIWLCINVFIGLISGEMYFATLSEFDLATEAPALMLLEAVDSFLLSFVFFIFSFGLYKIFFLSDSHLVNDKLPRWLQIESLFELKSLLWQSILTTLVVLFLNYAVIIVKQNKMSWEFLVLPCSILIISIALYFLKLAEKEEKAH